MNTEPTTPNTKTAPEHIAIAIVIAGGLVAAAILYSNLSTNNAAPTAAAPTAAPTEAEPIDPDSVVVEVDGYPTLGDPDAPVQMVEYSDFSCGFCKRFNDETKQAIIDTYVDAGLVHYVRKDLITVGTPLTAEAAHCAGDQNAYWEYSDTLYAAQETDRAAWNQEATLVEYAQELGLNATSFAECLAEDIHADKVAASSREAAQYGGSGTPFFLVNGNPVSGAQPFSAFEQAFASLGVTVE